MFLMPSPFRRRNCRFGLLLCLWTGLLAGGCGISIPRVAKVQVPEAKVLQSNAIAKEADVSFARKDYYAALIKYLEASRLNPNSAYIFNKVGITYSQLDFYDEAKDSFERSIGLNSEYVYPLSNLGSVYFALQDLRKAEQLYRKAIDMNADVAAFHINLGTLLYERKKFKKGMAQWRTGLSLDPNIFDKPQRISLVAAGKASSKKEKSYYVARLYASLGDVERAVTNLERALSNGFEDLKAIQKERDFDPIREDQRFIAFMRNASVITRQ